MDIVRSLRWQGNDLSEEFPSFKYHIAGIVV